jgi:tripartite-type tricarboxylate transporter receptor subunit TctC
MRTLGVWRGFIGPKGLPQEAVDVLVPALAKVVKDLDFVKFMNKHGFGIVYKEPKAFVEFMKASDTGIGTTMKATGIVK